MRAMFEVYEHPTCRRCGHAWETDPAIVVPCPVCSAPAGRPCPPPQRPSGYTAWTAHEIGWAHNDRDLAADAAHAYDHPCSREAPPMPKPTPGQLGLFDETTPDQLSLFDAPPPPPGGTPSTPIGPSEPPSWHLGPITHAQFEALSKTYSGDKLSSDQKHPTVRGMVAINGMYLVCTGRGWGKGTNLPEDITITRVARATNYTIPARGAHYYHVKTFTYRGDQWFCYGPTTHVKQPTE